MRILTISDLHYSDLSRGTGGNLSGCGVLSRTLLNKALLRLEYLNARPDLIVVLGDLLEYGDHPSAILDLIALKGELTRSGIPYLALPGNHDIRSEDFNRIMGTKPGLHRNGEYGFLVFNDSCITNTDYDTFIRPEEMIEKTRLIAAENPGLPLIALQHAPLYPSIDSDYPYNLRNSRKVMDCYEQCGVVLSLSGHYHSGCQPLKSGGTTLYYTVPSIAKSPFQFALIELKHGSVDIKPLHLKMDVDYITDVHCHTEHAYCGTTTDTAKCIALSQALGVAELCMTEHAFQLYFSKKTAMSFIWQSRPELVNEIWNTPARGRMRGYHDYARAVRSVNIRIGLELDLYDDGKLLLAPEDMQFGWDILVGAIHFIQGFKRGAITQHVAEELFMRDLQRMLAHGVHVIAHPFRFFGRNQLQTPTHLYHPVAELLAQYQTAAEINYHTHSPDPEFIKVCVKKGVKLALGSDTHDLREAGEFHPHLNLLKRAGIAPEEIQSHLYKLKQSREA
jgi:histidinol phosphatase-like PHP family hydrolase